MKKILAFILIISIVGVLASCGKEKATTEPKPKTCEQIEPCKTALQYATYVEQGAGDKAYKIENKDENLVSYDSEKDARKHVLSDYKKYQDRQIEKYGLLEYVLSPNKKYIYKFRFEDFRTGETKNTTVGIIKKQNHYFANEYYSPATKQDVTVDGKIAQHKRYYSSNLDEQMKQKFTPDLIEQY